MLRRAVRFLIMLGIALAVSMVVFKAPKRADR